MVALVIDHDWFSIPPVQVGAAWSYLDSESVTINKRWPYPLTQALFSYPEHPFVFGLVLFLGTWLSMMVSTVNGAGTPVLVGTQVEAITPLKAHLAKIDPAKIAGPLETAFQDVVSWLDGTAPPTHPPRSDSPSF